MSSFLPHRFSHSHEWVSPFTHDNLYTFYDVTCRKRAHEQRKLGQQETTDEGGFKWRCDVSGYLPEELKVELEGGQLLVTGEQNESNADQSVHRQLKRRVTLPEGIDPATIKCHIDACGMLEIHASRPKHHVEGHKRSIPLSWDLHTGQRLSRMYTI
ncbi:heat shock protein 16-48a [Aphelenchoides avenae]|nr:heat shock protein 16-48a [Aphelenchus avenae]